MKATCSPEVVAVLAAATRAASGARHAEVMREHVVAALLEIDELWTRVLPLRTCVDELRHLIDLRFSEMPTASPYRSGSTQPPLASEVSADVDLAEGRGLLRREVRLERFLAVVIAAPPIAPLVESARLDLDDLHVLLGNARRLASKQRHDAIYAEHVFRLLSDQRWFVRLFEQRGGDIERLRDRLDELLDGAPVMTMRGPTLPALELERLVDRVEVGARRTRQPATGADFVAFALEIPEVARVVERGGITAASLAEAIDSASMSDGRVRLDGERSGSPDAVTSRRPASREGSLTEVVFYNDASTPQAFVVSVLEEVFELPEKTAVRLMLTIHDEGQAIVGAYPEPVARNRVETVLARARAKRFHSSLRLELRPVGGRAR